MGWEASRDADVVRSYRLQYVLSQGDRADRELADREHWWAWEAIEEAVSDGTLPVAMLDALLHDPDADDRHRSYVGAGPIEELLRGRPDDYAELIAARCAADRSGPGPSPMSGSAASSGLRSRLGCEARAGGRRAGEAAEAV